MRVAVEMAGGSFGPSGVFKDRAKEYEGSVTWFVIFACIVAAVGGSIFGYDTGISGWVLSRDYFPYKFFHDVYNKKLHAIEDNYYKYNNKGIAAFNSIPYLAGMVASVAASYITRKYGCRASIICGGVSFFIGASLNASAVKLVMLIMGRIMIGIGLGFGN